MKRAAFVALCGALALACGGGGSGGGGGGGTFKDPNSVSFTFPDGAAPAVGSPEDDAAQSAASGLESMLAIGSAADTDAAAMVETIAGLPDTMSVVFNDSISPNNMGNARVSMSRRAAAFLVGDTAAATTGFPDGCVTVSADAIVFANCTASDTQDGVTFSQTVNGSFHRAAGHVWWDATMSMSETGVVNGEAVAFAFSYHMSGDVTFGDGAIKGFERADLSVSAKQGSSMDAAAKVTYNVDIDIAYLTGPFCISGGTLTVKLVWTEKPHGTGVPAEAQNPSDAGVRFTWAPNGGACSNAVTVAVGARQ